MERQQRLQLAPKQNGPVECLGITFDSDEGRREYFLDRLKEKLQEAEFRKTPGFPKGTDEDILRMSDPPYYTACPNPFLGDLVRVYGRPQVADEEYRREPFAVDVSVGKTDQLYRAHSYHTKVPYLAIVPSIKHYTQPGDLILDGFCGSGMVGVAVQVANQEDHCCWPSADRPPRRVILNDLSPIATFMAGNFNTPADIRAFAAKARQILREAQEKFGWMYTTIDPTTGAGCAIEYMVWSDIYSCPACSAEIVFADAALDEETSRVRAEVKCPHCGASASKSQLIRLYETRYDPYISTTVSLPKRKPVLVQYVKGTKRLHKTPDDFDLTQLQKVEALPASQGVPIDEIPYMHMTHERARLSKAGITHVHHFFSPRALQVLSFIWGQAQSEKNPRQRQLLLFFFEQAIMGMSYLNRYQPIQHGRPGGSQVNRYMTGVYYVPSQISEVSPWYNLGNRLDRLEKHGFSSSYAQPAVCSVTTGTCAKLDLPDACVDYIFTDPPFGENIYYSDLNFVLESWHRVVTDSRPEAIVDRAKHKSLAEYQRLMKDCFEEYYRVLKPGRWITVVFSNASNAVWRAIQEAMGTAGFVVADVRTLDKQQGSYRQVTSAAMKQDLVISAYKPTETWSAEFKLESSGEDSAWGFVNEHLANVPLLVAHGGESETIAERTPQMLLDRMIAFHVQRGIAVPLSAGDFFPGLEQRYAKRDGMYFLHDQVPDYDNKRAKVASVRQLSFMVNDEASAILWVRAELERKPQSFQDLQPLFMREIQSWAGHEKTVELKAILEENSLLYDGTGPVPTQIHTYLSTNFKDMRGLSKDDLILKAKGADRWYMPDPGKQSDLDQLRIKRLLKEFLEYKESKHKKLKLFRTEAVRAGFKAAYDQKDYRTIVDVAGKLPEQVIQEDEKLLMYCDVASMRLGED